MTKQYSHFGVDLPTITAIAVVAWASVTVIHEVVGHGGACLLVGGSPLGVSTTEMRCGDVVGWQYKVVVAAGSIANVIAALCCLALLRVSAHTASTWRYFLWLFITANLFHAGSYMLIGPFSGYGDWAYFVQGFEPGVLWKLGLTAIGYGICVIGTRLAALPYWQPLLGQELDERRTRMQLLTRIPLITAFIISVLAALVSPLQFQWVIVSAALAPLTLLWLVNLAVWPDAPQSTPALPLHRSIAWLVAGVVCFMLFVVILGPGIGSFVGHVLERR
jgi:hypothetical protein